MDKIKELEKRIETLEKEMSENRRSRSDKGLAKLRVIKSDSDPMGNIFEKYSEKNLPDEVKDLAIERQIEEANKKSDTAKKLQYWYDYLMFLSLDKNTSDKFFWRELFIFVENVILMYEMEVIKRLVKKGKYYEGKGNRYRFDPELTVKWWDDMSISYFYKDKNGKVLTTKIINEIRKKHNPDDANTKDGIPQTPSDKTIRNHLRTAGRL